MKSARVTILLLISALSPPHILGVSGLTHFASVPKCENSDLGDQVEIPSALIAARERKNISSEQSSVLLELTRGNKFQCEVGHGRVASLQVALHSLQDHEVRQVLTLFRSGYLVHDRVYYSPEQFCFQSLSNGTGKFTLSVKICEAKCSSQNNACVKKCCEPGKVWDLKDYSNSEGGSGVLSCENSGDGKEWRPTLYKNKYEKLEEGKAKEVHVRYMDAHPKNFCEGGFFLMTLKEYDGMEASPFRILRNGKALMKIGRSFWEEVPQSVYCVDGAMNFKSGDEDNSTGTSNSSAKSSANKNGNYSGDEEDTVMLVCTGFLEDPEGDFDGGPNLLYVVAMLISSVFLFLTALVYVILWKRQSIAHGGTFLGYVMSLLLTFIFLSVAHTADGDCAFIGIACHFFFLSTFTWLTALNFDIYWTFRLLNPNPGRRKEVIRFLCYSIFAVGVPVIIVSVGLILDAIYGDDPESEVIVPRYGVTRCTLDRSADLPYLFGPISFLLSCNLILFPTTLWHIYQSQKITKLSGMKSNMLKHKIRFFAKLFILAGVTWIFEVISWACTDPAKPIHWIWKLLDLINILQAIAIFVVFVCNRKTLDELAQKFPCLKRVSSVLEKASGVANPVSRRQQQQQQQGNTNTNTNVSSIFDAPGLDTIELSGGGGGGGAVTSK